MLYCGSIGHNNNNIMATNQQQNNNNNINNNSNSISINNNNNINSNSNNNNNSSNSSSSNNNNGNSYGESTTSTSIIPPSITTSLTPTLSSQPTTTNNNNNIHNLHQTPILTTTTTQVLSPMMGSKRKLEEDPIQSGLTSNDFLLGSNSGLKPILVSSPLAQSPGLTSIQMAFANTSLSTPSTPLNMSPSLGPCSAPMSPSKKSKNSRNSKSKYLNTSTEDGQNSRWGNTTNSNSKPSSPGIVKGPWKDEEDAKLVELVQKCGPKEWSSIAAKIPGRIGKQCRERWFNHLSPEVRKTNWTAEEDKIIIDAHASLGNKWTAISKMLDGRPANAIKNHWNSTLLKRIGGSESKSSPSSLSANRDDDDDEDDEDQDGSSPVLSPISLYQSDPSQQSQLNGSIPPFALSSSITNNTTTTNNSISNNSNNSLTTNEPLVAPKIIRAQTTPTSSPLLSSKKSHDKQKVPQSPKTIGKNNQSSLQQQPVILSQPHIQQLPIDQQIQNIQIQYNQPNVNIQQQTPTTLDQYQQQQQYQLMQQYQQQYLQQYYQSQSPQTYTLQQQQQLAQHLAAQQQQQNGFNNNVDMPFSIGGTTSNTTSIETQEVPYYYDYWGASNTTAQPLMSQSDTSIPTSTSTTAAGGFSHEFTSMDPNSDFLLFDSDHNRIQPLQQHQHIKQDHAQISHLPYHPNHHHHAQQHHHHHANSHHHTTAQTNQSTQHHSTTSSSTSNLSQSQPAVSTTTQTQDQGYINYDISSLFNVEI